MGKEDRLGTLNVSSFMKMLMWSLRIWKAVLVPCIPHAPWEIFWGVRYLEDSCSECPERHQDVSLCTAAANNVINRF